MSTKGYLSIIGVIIVLAGMLAWINHSSQQPDSSSASPKPPPVTIALNEKSIAASWPALLKVAAGPPLGNPKAPYTMVEIGDFQCPNCGEARSLIESAWKSGNGRASLYFVNFPLTQVHPHAIAAAEAGLSGAAQGKFWPMYNLLYSHQDELIPSEIEYDSRSIPGLNSKKVADDMRANTYAASIRQSMAFCQKIGIQSTPTILIKDPAGKVTVYLGTSGGDYNGSAGKTHALGAVNLAAAPPWGNGIGPAAKQILSQEQINSANGPE